MSAETTSGGGGLKGRLSADPAGAARNEPRCRGVARMADNDRAILLSFDRPISDDELRALHDSLRHRLPAPPASEAWPTHPIEGVPVVGANVTEITLGKPASEAGHREESDEGLVGALLREADTPLPITGDLTRELAIILTPLQGLMRDAAARLRQLRADGERLREIAKSNIMAHEQEMVRARADKAEAVQRAREEAAREQMERDAKIVCGWCRKYGPPEPGKKHFVSDGLQPKGDPGRWVSCEARAIRSQPPGAAQPQEGV